MIFAKLFERDGQQVLVTKEHDDEGEPELKFRFKSNNAGHDITVKIGFKKDTELDTETLMEQAFEKADEALVFGLRDTSPGVTM